MISHSQSLVLILGLFICGTCSADEPTSTIRFSEVFNSLVQERQRPQVYEVKYKLVQQFLQADHKRGLVETPKPEDSSARRIETIGLVRFDEIGGKLYCEQKSRLQEFLDPNREESWKKYVAANYKNGFKLIIPGSKLEFDANENRIVEKPMPTDIESEIPVDFKIFGLCNSADLRKGKSFEEVASRVFTYFKDWECPVDDMGVAIVDLRNEIYRIDTKKGFWPIERKAFYFETRNGKQMAVPHMGQDIKLIEINGNWVPKSVFVMDNSSSSLSYDFDWVTYDELLEPNAFDLMRIRDKWIEKEKAIAEKAAETAAEKGNSDKSQPR